MSTVPKRKGSLILLTVVAVLLLGGLGMLLFSHPGGSGSSDAAMFMGLRDVPAGELHSAVPTAKGKPSLIMFTSKLCLECKKLTPVVMKLLPKYPGVHFQKYDILEDRDKYPVVFDRFQPVSVPTLVFVSPKGEIKNVLYNDQPEQKIVTSLETVSEI